MMRRYIALLLISASTIGLILTLIYDVFYSFLINSIATVLLVGITAVYAYLTYELVRETTQGRKDAVVPVIKLSVDEWGPKLSNIGNGPAVDLYACLTLDGDGQSDEKFEIKEKNLRAGDEIEILDHPFVTIPDPNGDANRNYDYLNIYWECNDIFGHSESDRKAYELDDLIISEESGTDTFKEGVAQLAEIRSALHELKATNTENQQINASDELLEYIREEQEMQRDRHEFERRRAEAGLLTRAKWWLIGMDTEECSE